MRKKLLVLLTDGLHNGGSYHLGYIGKHIRNLGISILAISIGNQVDYSQLVAIAGTKNVYNASSFNELTTRRFVQNAVNASCSFSKYDFINMQTSFEDMHRYDIKTFPVDMHTYVHTYMHACMHTDGQTDSQADRQSDVCICIHLCIYAYI